MAYRDFMNKVRHLDNLTARWMMRHFYTMFFQIVLVVIFVFWFINLFSVIDSSVQVTRSSSLVERLLFTQTIFLTITVFLFLLNSFWLLFTFSSIQRLRTVLKDINYNISRLRQRNKRNPDQPHI